MVFFLFSSPVTVGRRGQHDDGTLDDAPLGRPRNDGMERQSVISADDREIDAPRDPIVNSCGLLGSSLPASVMFTLLASSARSCPAVGARADQPPASYWEGARWEERGRTEPVSHIWARPDGSAPRPDRQPSPSRMTSGLRCSRSSRKRKSSPASPQCNLPDANCQTLARFPQRHSPPCEHSHSIAVPERQERFYPK